MVAVSIPNKFIFIHVYKVAGKSIRKALEPYLFRSKFERKLNKWTNIFINKLGVEHSQDLKYLPLFLRQYPDHISAVELRELVPTDFYDQCFKFAFVRNPWDWQVSLYFYILCTPTHFQHELIKSFANFDDYIHWRTDHEVSLQKEFVVDRENNIIVDFIGRFENLNNDFKNIYQKLNIVASLPHINKSNHRDYRSYYSDKTVTMIEDAFREDIDFFGYSFEE